MSGNENVDDPARTAAFVSQPIGLSEEFQPVKWSCRAPMTGGKLCPRRDRYKCPLHGPIIARDVRGNPTDPSKIANQSKNTVPDWQEPGLLADIKAATGVDLTMPKKGQRSTKVKYPNLTDIAKLKNTTRCRLEKKVFNKYAHIFAIFDLKKTFSDKYFS